MKHIATRNIHIQSWINFLAGVTFLVPIITIFYKYTGLSLFEIVLISNVSTFFIFALELPTSVLADTIGRKFSLVSSVVANLCGATMILLFPNLYGFTAAAVFSALYWAFWSGTGQAFLADNLAKLDREHEFGKVFGGLIFYEQLATIVTPLMASGVLYLFADQGYKILAGLDVIFAFILVLLTLKLKEITKKKKNFSSARQLWDANLKTAKTALKSVFGSAQLRLFTAYRSLGSGVTFIGLIILPTLAVAGMVDFWSGVVITTATVFFMFASKYAYIFAEKWNYRKVWVMASFFQAVTLIIAGFFTDYWIYLAIVFAINQFFLGIEIPTWNHILVEATKGKALVTIRSIIMGIFCLYITLGKQFLALFPIEQALIGLGCFILLVNLILGPKILKQ